MKSENHNVNIEIEFQEFAAINCEAGKSFLQGERMKKIKFVMGAGGAEVIRVDYKVHSTQS